MSAGELSATHLRCILRSMSQIESLTNSRIKALVPLRKRSERDRTGTFIIEEERELEAALESKEVIELFIAEDLLTAHGKRVAARAAEADIPMTPPSVRYQECVREQGITIRTIRKAL